MNKMTDTQVLLRNGFVALNPSNKSDQNLTAMVATLVSNIATYGYKLSVHGIEVLSRLNKDEIQSFWSDLEPSLKVVTGTDRQMDKYVVYKNFPKEVLEMSQLDYWVRQILMYMGAPNELFTEEEKNRESLLEDTKYKVLHLAKESTLEDICVNLAANAARWSDVQDEVAKYLTNRFPKDIHVDSFGFKENGIILAKYSLVNEVKNSIFITTATDVLRLNAALSDQDVSLREKVRFKRLSRNTRKYMLSMLENCSNLEDDVAMRPEMWKRFLGMLHPGDYSFCTRVQVVYDKLYNRNLPSFNAKVDPQIKTVAMLETLKQRPGVFLRKFHDMYNTFGAKASEAFVKVIPSLSLSQLVKFKRYLATISDRKTLMYAPNGNWAKSQIEANTKKIIVNDELKALLAAIDAQLYTKLIKAFPQGINADNRLDQIKLQTNDQKLAEYGRGTVFDIPQDITFIRSASYWEQASHGNSWFDNGWNFFDSNWNSKGVCAWNKTAFSNAAVFSGDPTNSKDLKGRGCQMIDLYLDKLQAQGVRYAVWSVLCYSNIKFADATDVLATLQMGEKAESGKLYEPARAQMVFPLKNNALASYVAYIDIAARKLVYMDVGFKADVFTAVNNSSVLSSKMPAYVEYLNSLPSVMDLVGPLVKKNGVPFVYSDEGMDINADKAYVFRPSNHNNKYDPVNIMSVLAD